MSAQQKKYPFDFKTQYGLSFNQRDDEIVVDFFCGGGGAGTGLEMALNRAVTVAKNHSPAARCICVTTTMHPLLALVTVPLKGTPFVIVDICLRMLQPAELYKAQGFPGDDIINHSADGKPFTKTQQIHIYGNSVSPPPMAALARANNLWYTVKLQQVA